jgi:polyhydroxybutyrate depolymerase
MGLRDAAGMRQWLMRFGLVGCSLFAAMAPFAACAEVLHVMTGQGQREAILLPAKGVPVPAVIVLHGATASANWTAQNSGFAEGAAEHGFAAVFPEGIDRQWNDGREGRNSSVDDVAFLRQLVHELIGHRIADPARLYLAGISNGGMMTFRLLCEDAGLFAGAATIIANMPASVGEHCGMRKPVPLVMFNGTADPLVPYQGGGVGFAGRRGTVWGAERTAQFIAQANACGTTRVTPLPISSPTEPSHATKLEWSHCQAGADVALYRFEGSAIRCRAGAPSCRGCWVPATRNSTQPRRRWPSSRTALELHTIEAQGVGDHADRG